MWLPATLGVLVFLRLGLLAASLRMFEVCLAGVINIKFLCVQEPEFIGLGKPTSQGMLPTYHRRSFLSKDVVQLIQLLLLVLLIGRS